MTEFDSEYMDNQPFVFRMKREGHLFLHSKAKELGIPKSKVARKMFTYAAKNMTSEDYRNG